MERRVLLAAVLCFLVLYGYQALFVPDEPAPAGSSSQSPSASSVPPSVQPPALTADPVVAAPRAPTAAPLVASSEEREVVVETAVVRAVFTNRGARLKHWLLKNYPDAAGKPIDLVPSGLPADQPTPFSLRVEDAGLTHTLNSALYEVANPFNPQSRIDATTAPATLTFQYQDTSGVHVRKQFRFEPDSFVVVFSASVTQGESVLNPEIEWGPGLSDLGATSGGGSFFTGNYVQPPEAIYHTGEDVERVAAASLGEQPAYEGNLRFAGTDDHYFIAAAVNPGQARVQYRALQLPMPGDAEQQRHYVSHSIRLAKAPEGVRFFIGPKAFSVLKAVDGEFVRAINFGIFAFLAVPLLGALQWVYGFVGNYGLAIVVLTILINLAMSPLRHKTVVSMRRMQELQPQLKSIQDRYKDLKVTDPARQKMNTEVMNLYREKGVNPASGCVPMLLTMPVLFAFYSLLSQAIELRGADFGLWIHDLSAKDPYYITPLLMGATMFWQQKIQPTSADPAQARVMLIMPVVFTAMFLGFPSGLAIYYFVSNLWNIGQQYFTIWMIGPAPVHVVRPAAERRAKNVGAGKTDGAR